MPDVRRVLVIDRDDQRRREIVVGLEAIGVVVVSAHDAPTALERVATSRIRPDAVIVDPQAAGLDRTRFEVPVVMLCDDPAHLPAVTTRPRALVGDATDARVLLRVLEAVIRGEPPPLPARIASGTAHTLPVASSIDLHEYAAAKLQQYLGERARGVMADLLHATAIGRIATTADLRRFAAALQALGAIEAAVAALLVGRATLIEADSSRQLP